MHIAVNPRYVAAPWEIDQVDRRTVGLEDDVHPEPGPLAEYLAAFPDRYVTWSRPHQLFAVHERGVEGPDALIELVCHWDARPELELTDEEIAQMAGRSPDVIRRFMPFDYPFVHRRLRERAEYRATKAKHATERAGNAAFSRRINDRNAALAASRRKAVASNKAQALGEIRNWLPVLVEFEETGRWNPGARTPVVAGAALT